MKMEITPVLEERRSILLPADRVACTTVRKVLCLAAVAVRHAQTAGVQTTSSEKYCRHTSGIISDKLTTPIAPTSSDMTIP